MKDVRKMTVAALFLALGLVLPFAFHSFGPGAGAMFLPMHLPVLLCGFLCGGVYGAMIGVLTPLLSSVLTGMPMFFPNGISMMLELATYGCLCGLLMKKMKLYPALITSMLAGRVVSGIMNMILLNLAGKTYSLTIFLTASFVTALPGILLQLLLVPMMVIAVRKLQENKQDKD